MLYVTKQITIDTGRDQTTLASVNTDIVVVVCAMCIQCSCSQDCWLRCCYWAHSAHGVNIADCYAGVVVESHFSPHALGFALGLAHRLVLNKQGLPISSTAMVPSVSLTTPGSSFAPGYYLTMTFAPFPSGACNILLTFPAISGDNDTHACALKLHYMKQCVTWRVVHDM